MIPRGAKHVVDSGLHADRGGEAVDQIAGLGADDFGTEDSAVFGIGDDLHVASGLAHEDGFAVVVEGVAGDEVGGFLFC